MPRLIDHAERAAAIGRACLAVLERDGISALSVRNVATEAGIAVASLRRAFPTQNELRIYCLNLVRERAEQRIAAVSTIGRERVVEILEQLLPLDDVRRTEFLAQSQLEVLALTDGQLREAAAALHDDVRRACAYAIDLLDDEGGVDRRRDKAIETDRLHAIVDGLAMHGMWHAGSHDRPRVSAMLELHLAELGRAPKV